MQPARPPPRAPGSFTPLPGQASSSSPAMPSPPPPQQQQQQRSHPPHRSESNDGASAASAALASARARAGSEASGDDDDDDHPSLSIAKYRNHPQSAPSPPPVASPSARAGSHARTQQQQQQQQQHNTASTANPQNFSRPTAPRPQHSDITPASGGRTASPLTRGYHHRKHSQTQGLFEPSLPSTSTSNLSQIGMAQSQHQNQHQNPTPQGTQSSGLTASQIAAQAAFGHKNTPNTAPSASAHNRHRSQTVPAPGEANNDGARRGSGSKGPLSPPVLSLTEASAPRESGFENQGYHNGLLGNPSAAAATAANAAYPRSGQSSPGLPQPPPLHPPSPVQPLTQTLPDSHPTRPAKPEKEKSKHKLFSRPGKINIKGDPKEKPLPSPSKIGSALASLQRGNFSTSSLVDPGSSAQSMYSLNNSSAATIRPAEGGGGGGGGGGPIDKDGKEKEKKHNFLARQKQKLKDEYHLPLSSAASNSKPTDPNAPSSLYNFNVPAGSSPVAGSTSFNKVRKDKKHGERDRSDSRLENESTYALNSERAGTSHGGSTVGGSSLTSLPNYSSAYLADSLTSDSAKHGVSGNVSSDDAWPHLKAKMLVVFEGEDLRQPVEDFNRLVNMHIQYCVQRRSPNIILDDLRELLATGFASLDHTLRRTQEDKVIPALVEMWLVTYTSILPYMQAVFLPLDLEFAGCGAIMKPEQATEFWGGIVSNGGDTISPASAVLDVRRIVLAAYRDIVILPRYDQLKAIFSRLSLEFLPSSFANMALSSSSSSSNLPDPSLAALSTSPSGVADHHAMRPGTAMSLDPSVASYGSQSTTLFGDSGSGAGSVGASRSRAISNVSYQSGGSEGQLRPFTPSGGAQGHHHYHANQQHHAPYTHQQHSQPHMHQHHNQHHQQMMGGGSSVREQNVEDSKQVTEMVGRMLQCMSILASVGAAGAGGDDEGNKKMEELCRLLKLNWLGRGRTGRNRRGIVGGRVRRDAGVPGQVPEGFSEGVRVS